MDNLIEKYGSVEAARQRLNGMMNMGRAPTDEEAQETADLIRALALTDQSAPIAMPVVVPIASVPPSDPSPASGDMLDVEEWARSKKTHRDLLCVAATALGWELQPDYGDPTIVSESAYDVAIEGAKRILADAAQSPKLAGRGRKGMLVLTVPGQLVAVIARKLDARESKKIVDELADDNDAISDNAQTQMMGRATLWPTGAILENVKDTVPLAWANAWPRTMLEVAGINASKKKR